jgi:hypothetical protein
VLSAARWDVQRRRIGQRRVNCQTRLSMSLQYAKVSGSDACDGPRAGVGPLKAHLGFVGKLRAFDAERAGKGACLAAER